jgi:hypothetical protein
MRASVFKSICEAIESLRTTRTMHHQKKLRQIPGVYLDRCAVRRRDQGVRFRVGNLDDGVDVSRRTDNLDRVRAIDLADGIDCFIEIPGAHPPSRVPDHRLA